MKQFEHILELARDAAPEPIQGAEADAWVKWAVIESQRRSPFREEDLVLAAGVVSILAAVAAAFLVGWMARPVPAPLVQKILLRPAPSTVVQAAPAPEIDMNALQETILPTGDELHASPGTHYAVVDLTHERRVALHEGTMLFDVRPTTAARPAFFVSTPDGVVEVRGTVFSVEVERGQTVVRVYEGRVVVRQGGHERALGPSDAVALDEEGWQIAPGPGEVDRMMSHAADRAVRNRHSGDAVADADPTWDSSRDPQRPAPRVGRSLDRPMVEPAPSSVAADETPRAASLEEEMGGGFEPAHIAPGRVPQYTYDQLLALPNYPGCRGDDCGSLMLVSDPWCVIVLNGARLGATPILGSRLPVGHHSALCINPEEQLGYIVDFDIRADRPTRLHIGSPF